MQGRIREIRIQPCINGYVCYIGCQIAVFNDPLDMVNALHEYLTNPEKTEKEWQERTRVWNPEPVLNREQPETYQAGVMDAIRAQEAECEAQLDPSRDF